MSEQSTDGTEHNWELKGGAQTQNSKPSMPFGLSMWQCRKCGLAATRALTARSESLNAILPAPNVDESCSVEPETDQ